MPTDPEEKFVYHSEWLMAAALTQSYRYMIENGLECSKLATREADVFLLVKEDELHTLYYVYAYKSRKILKGADIHTINQNSSIFRIIIVGWNVYN